MSRGCTADGQTPPGATEVATSTQQPAGSPFAAVPLLGELTSTVVYGEIWERSQLSKRDRSLVTIALFRALYRDQLRGHLNRGLEKRSDPRGDPRGDRARVVLYRVADGSQRLQNGGRGVSGTGLGLPAH